jgi:hypothetical protein
MRAIRTATAAPKSIGNQKSSMIWRQSAVIEMPANTAMYGWGFMVWGTVIEALCQL